MAFDTKKILWENVLTLMKHKFGKENLTGFANYVGIGVASVQRIREQKTSVGIEIVDAISKKYGLEPWHLLVPGLVANNPPVLAVDSARVKELMENVKRSTRALAGAIERDGNTEAGEFDDAVHVQPTAVSDQPSKLKRSDRKAAK